MYIISIPNEKTLLAKTPRFMGAIRIQKCTHTYFIVMEKEIQLAMHSIPFQKVVSSSELDSQSISYRDLRINLKFNN